MNKKILVAICLFFIFLNVNKSFSQCVPNPNNTNLITPDSATGFVSGTVGVAYSQIVYIHPPIDTTVQYMGNPVHINPVDSIVINNFANLPPGLSYACVPANCVFPGGLSGCGNISGIPATSGNYQLSVDITGYGKLAGTGFQLPVPFTITSYHININSNTLVPEINQNSNFQLLEFGPDPVQEHLTFEMNSPVTTNADLSVFNILGKNVYSKSTSLKQGVNTINLNTKNLSSGVYILTLKKDSYVLLRRFVIGGK